MIGFAARFLGVLNYAKALIFVLKLRIYGDKTSEYYGDELNEGKW